MDQIENLRDGGVQLVALLQACVGIQPSEEQKRSVRDMMMATSSALERLAPTLKSHDPALADQLIRGQYEFLKSVKAALMTGAVQPELLQEARMARQGSEEHLHAARTLLLGFQSPRGLSRPGAALAASPAVPATRPYRSPSSPAPVTSSSSLSPRGPSAALASPRIPPTPSPLSPRSPPALSPRSPALSPRFPTTGLASPRSSPTLASPRSPPALASPRSPASIASPVNSPRFAGGPTTTLPTSPRPVPAGRVWEEEDRLVCERAMAGVDKALRVLKILSSGEARAHAKEIAEMTREGLSDLTLVGNRAQALGLDLPSATLKASSAQLTQLIRETLVGQYAEEEGERIAKDLAISVRAIMFSPYFNSVRAVREQDENKPETVEPPRPVPIPLPTPMSMPVPVPVPAATPVEPQALKQSFRALDSVLARRKLQFADETKTGDDHKDKDEDEDDDETEEDEPAEGSGPIRGSQLVRAHSLYARRPTVSGAGPSAAPATQPAPQAQRLTVNLGALPHGTNLRSSNSMPERTPSPLSGGRLPSSPSSFKPPVISASDERAVGKRLTVRRPVFLTGALEATRFTIGGNISFRVTVNNMHKRPVKGVMLKLYKLTASFTYKHHKSSGESERRVESRHRVRVAAERAAPEGFPVQQGRQWAGLIEFKLPRSLPPSIVADSAATYEIVYLAKLKLLPKSCAIELGPFELHEA